ncbi:VOC family protein [Labrys monachus]|uniref:Catechol 2,3-dioxygenase-like lactoylglutathione lyase family enzyme n=1 Tax=Labrys monachus TaxID=217067 RepID=A0ABU0FAZ6_9HYPH|nr:VOC family protein [Labrys monachus]MDQ0391775.1 catechol 2,3-dioxygenase-like lactoylglutathione lyase family enzyme [Labrys monachus]
MPRLERIVETAVYVEDLDRAAAFYETVLGLEALVRLERLHAFDVGGCNVLLVFKRGASDETQIVPGGSIPPHDASGRIHVCFAVPAADLAAWEARLAAHGVAVEGRAEWPAGGRSLYFRDPDGHMLELMTPGVWRTY